MTILVRSLVVLLIAVFAAGTLALPGAVAKAEASVTMVAMPMGPVGQDCPKGSPQTAMTAGCDLSCAVSIAAILVGPATPAIALTSWRFDMADATASGQAPPPADTPPRTFRLI